MIYGSARPSYITMLDPIQNQGLRLCLCAFRTSPAVSLAVEANELPLSLRREKLALQYISKIAAIPTNPVYECIFNPNFSQLFENKPNAIPTFGIRHRESIETLAIEPDAIANFQYPDTPPWTYTPLNINLILAKSKRDATNPIEFSRQVL